MVADRTKRTLLVLLAISLMAVLVLASGLPGMEMTMGSLSPSGGAGGGFGGGFDMGMDPRLLQAIIMTGALLIPVAIIWFFVSPDMRKRVLRDGMGLVVITMMLYVILLRSPQLEGLAMNMAPPQGDGGVGSSEEGFLATEPNFDPPPILMWTAAGLLVAVGGVLLWRTVQNRPEYAADTLVEDLRSETQDAVDRLRAGENVKELVTRCYLRMHRALAESRGVHHRELLTPREFEQRMMAVTGLPAEPINRLTRLFERVRYGDHEANEAEKAEALAALEAINKALNI